MRKALENYAFIDSQNLNLGVRDPGWKLDYQKFRIYLTEKYGDFHCLVKYLYEQGKLLKVLIPNRHKFSVLLRKAIPLTASYYLVYMDDLRKRLEYIK